MSDSYLISDVIARKAGFVVSIKELCVYRDSTGTYKVSYTPIDQSQEKIDKGFESRWEAANFFIKKRNELGLGFDKK